MQLQLFGELRAFRHGEECELPPALGQQLLAYLAIFPGWQMREVVAEALWPDLPPGQGRRNLSDQLYQIKQALGQDWINAETGKLALNSGSLQVDLWEFERLLAEPAEENLAAAIDLYHGELLPGYYQDWVLTRRLSAREAFLEALETIGGLRLRAGDAARAAAAFQRLVGQDPLREGGVRGLMRALAASDRIPRALEVYSELEATLQAELDVPPSEATQQLVQQLKAELAARQQSPTGSSGELPLVGRGQERANALGLVERAMAGAGAALAFEGPAGIGKSRLLREIADGARWRGAAVIWGTSSERSDRPYQALSQALESVVQRLGPKVVEGLLPASTLAALSPLCPLWADLDDLPELPQDLAFERMSRALEEFWIGLADTQPLLLVLDDMHWGKRDQWRALEPLITRIDESSLALLLAYRRDEAEQEEGWSTLIKLEREGVLEVRPLRPLAVDDVIRLLTPEQVGDAQKMVDRTGGIPLYIVAELMEGGNPPVDRDPWSGRAQRLPEEQRRAISAAAVLSDEFEFESWRAVASMEQRQLARAAAALVQAGFLQYVDGRYAFTHDLIRQKVYQLVDPGQTRRLHERAAQRMRAQPEVSHERLAQHLALAGHDQEAAESYLLAGERALAQYATAQAAAHYKAGLELAPADCRELRYDLASQWARALEFEPDPDARAAALGAARHAAEQLQDPARQIEVCLALCDLHSRQGELDQAKAELEQARSLNDALEDPQLALRIKDVSGDMALRLGDTKAASLAFRQAADLAEQLGARRQQGRALDGLAFCLASLGASFEEISGLFEQALVLFRQEGDSYNRARTLINYLSACQNAGAWDRMEALGPEMFEVLEGVGYRLGEGIAHQTFGLAACYQGDFEAAMGHFELSIERFRQSGDPLAVSLATTGIGQVLRRRGELEAAEDRLSQARQLAKDAQAGLGIAFAEQELGLLIFERGRTSEARALLDSAQALWESAGDPGNLALCRAGLGLCSLHQGDHESAEALAQQLAAELLEADQAFEGEEPQVVLWMLHQLLAGLGHDRRAEAALSAAAAALKDQVQRLSDPAFRRRMMLEVPTNREVAMAWLNSQGLETELEVELASRGAPLGRPLRPEERVQVRWTLISPEDETISDPVDRRRYVLRRLLEQAGESAASPTDGDLASALGVSRRTILRDMKALEQAGHLPATRGRGDH